MRRPEVLGFGALPSRRAHPAGPWLFTRAAFGFSLRVDLGFDCVVPPDDLSPPMQGLLRSPRIDPTDRFGAASSGPQMSVVGRQLPTVDVGYPDAQLGSQLSGGEIAHPAVAGRPSVAASVATPMPAVQRRRKFDMRCHAHARDQLLPQLTGSFLGSRPAMLAP